MADDQEIIKTAIQNHLTEASSRPFGLWIDDFSDDCVTVDGIIELSALAADIRNALAKAGGE